MKISLKPNLPPIFSNPYGEVLQEILGRQAAGATSHSLAEVTIPPGKASLPHFHKISEESYLILSGQATMVIDTEHFELAPGEAVLIEPFEVHQIFNNTQEDLVFLAVCVPAWYPEDSFDAA